MATFQCPQQHDPGLESIRSIEARIKCLVEEGNVTEARKEIARVPPDTSELLNRWKLVLSEPRGRLHERASGGSLKQNLLWLQENSRQYPGRWVALKEGQLLGSNPSRLALRTSLKEAGDLKGAMFFRVEE